MSDDKIAEIRERHLHDERWSNGPSMISPQAHADRATLLAEVDRLRADNERLLQAAARAEVEIRPAVYVLLSDDREDHDGLSDEICGCYLSREAAERAGNELNVRWRIEEYGLEGKP